MIKVVVDTGVVVSAALRDGKPEEVVLFIVEQETFEWIVSPAILKEYAEVLARAKFGLPSDVLHKWRELLKGVRRASKQIFTSIFRVIKRMQSSWNVP